MNILKLKTVDSTNRYLKKLLRSENQLPNFFTVWTPQQTAGVGQYGAKWETAPYQNLTFSMFFIPEKLSLNNAFLLNMLVPIVVMMVLEEYKKEYKITDELSIKWPNDLLIANKKIGGILIENVLQQQQITKSVIGIGLNVNQTNFEGLPKAASLKNFVNVNIDIEQLMKRVVTQLEISLSELSSASFEEIYDVYKQYLFRLNKVSTFRLPNGTHFIGIIKGTTPEGELVVATESTTQTFSLKQIELCY